MDVIVADPARPISPKSSRQTRAARMVWQLQFL
jgi:hypothetical protein